MDSADCIVVGYSVAGAAAALRLSEQGSSVAVIEYPNEVPMRARPLIWETPASKRDRTGADFEALMDRMLDQAGVRIVRDVEALELRGNFAAVRRFADADSLEIEAGRVIYASDGVWNTQAVPEPARDLIGRGVSVSAWIDSTFYLGKKVAVVGAGDFAFEQLYWAGQCASELIWLNPEPKPMISEDLADRIELPVIPTLRNSAAVESIRREGSSLRVSTSNGETASVHGVFFAAPPLHFVKTAQHIGATAGVPWTHFAAAWEEGDRL